jgi:hypothetical protein
MAYRFTETLLGAQPIADTETTQNAAHPIGTIVRAVDPTYGPGEFIYLKGVASTVVGSWVLINADDWTTSLLTANDRGPVGVAMSANVANQYGWYQITGKAVGKCLTQFADNGRVYITATAGSVDDASVAGDVVWEAKGASTTVVDSTVADFEIHRPFVADRVSIIS